MHSQKLTFTFSVRPEHVHFYEMSLKENRKRDHGNGRDFAVTVGFLLHASQAPHIEVPSPPNRRVEEDFTDAKAPAQTTSTVSEQRV